MINIRVPIEDLENTVISPVIVSVLNELKKILFLDKDIHLQIQNKESEYINKNWKAGNTDNKDINGPKRQKVLVEYETTFNEQEVTSVRYRSNVTKNVLLDKVTFFNVRALYVPTTLNIKFIINDKSKVQLSNTINRLRLRYIQNRDAFYHCILYYYYLPEFVSDILNNIVTLKNLQLDTTDTFDEYLASMVDEKFTLINNQSGNMKSIDLAFKEVQNSIIGYFQNDMLNPEKTYNKDTGYWETELEYQIRFDQPMFYDVEYPTVAYNFSLDERFTNVLTTTNRDCENKNTLDFTNDIRFDNSYLRIPSTDNHRDIEPRELYTRIFSVLTTISKDDKRFLFNLKDLGNLEIIECIMSFLEEGEWRYITKTLESAIQLELFENDKMVYDDVITVDKNLNVYANRDLDLAKTYRVFFNVVEFLNALTPEAKRRAIEHKCLLDSVTKIVDLKNEVINTGTRFPRNLDIKFKLKTNEDRYIKFYSFIIACFMKRKEVCDDRI